MQVLNTDKSKFDESLNAFGEMSLLEDKEKANETVQLLSLDDESNSDLNGLSMIEIRKKVMKDL